MFFFVRFCVFCGCWGLASRRYAATWFIDEKGVANEILRSLRLPPDDSLVRGRASAVSSAERRLGAAWVGRSTGSGQAPLIRGMLIWFELFTLLDEGLLLTEGVWRMRRLFFAYLSAVLVVVSVATQRGVAQQDVSILDHYRVVPQRSTLHKTDGAAGLDSLYRLTGDYDFAHSALPTIGAKFVNANIVGTPIPPGPTAAANVIDVDQLLNLDGLTGKLLPVAAAFNVYQFQGHAADGSAVNLYASVLGPWMYLRGGTQPPASSADYFTYQLRALARTGPFADLNGDGVVDASDYALLRKSGFAGGIDAATGASFADWRQQFGEAMPDLNAMDAMINTALGSGVAASSVPEPGCLGLVVFGGMLVAGRRSSRRR